MRLILAFLLFFSSKSYSSVYDQCIKDGGTPEVCLGVDKVTETVDAATKILAVGTLVITGYLVYRVSEDKNMQWDNEKILLKNFDNGSSVELNFSNPNKNQYFGIPGEYYLGITLRF